MTPSPIHIPDEPQGSDNFLHWDQYPVFESSLSTYVLDSPFTESFDFRLVPDQVESTSFPDDGPHREDLHEVVAQWLKEPFTTPVQASNPPYPTPLSARSTIDPRTLAQGLIVEIDLADANDHDDVFDHSEVPKKEENQDLFERNSITQSLTSYPSFVGRQMDYDTPTCSAPHTPDSILTSVATAPSSGVGPNINSSPPMSPAGSGLAISTPETNDVSVTRPTSSKPLVKKNRANKTKSKSKTEVKAAFKKALVTRKAKVSVAKKKIIPCLPVLAEARVSSTKSGTNATVVHKREKSPIGYQRCNLLPKRQMRSTTKDSSPGGSATESDPSSTDSDYTPSPRHPKASKMSNQTLRSSSPLADGDAFVSMRRKHPIRTGEKRQTQNRSAQKKYRDKNKRLAELRHELILDIYITLGERRQGRLKDADALRRLEKFTCAFESDVMETCPTTGQSFMEEVERSTSRE